LILRILAKLVRSVTAVEINQAFILVRPSAHAGTRPIIQQANQTNIKADNIDIRSLSKTFSPMTGNTHAMKFKINPPSLARQNSVQISDPLSVNLTPSSSIHLFRFPFVDTVLNGIA
jgi:hypothetical protein